MKQKNNYMSIQDPVKLLIRGVIRVRIYAYRISIESCVVSSHSSCNHDSSSVKLLVCLTVRPMWYQIGSLGDKSEDRTVLGKMLIWCRHFYDTLGVCGRVLTCWKCLFQILSWLATCAVQTCSEHTTGLLRYKSLI